MPMSLADVVSESLEPFDIGIAKGYRLLRHSDTVSSQRLPSVVLSLRFLFVPSQLASFSVTLNDVTDLMEKPIER